jgi:protein MPE1
MYLAGTPQSLPLSEPVPRGSSISSGTTYHKGAMSKRFDGKDEQASLSKPPLNVSLFHTIYL